MGRGGACVTVAGCGTGTDGGGASATTVAEAPAVTPDLGPPAEPAPGPLYGDPAEASKFWAEQSFQDCGLMAVATVVGLVTGTAPSEQDMIQVASSLPSPDGTGPLYVPPQDGDDSSDNGTSPEGQVRLLKHFGVPATITDDVIASTGGIPTGLEAVQQYLAADRKVIVSVNAETIWGEDANHTDPDHALVVGAIDTDQQIVYLSDSGTESGAGEQISIDTFEKAWGVGEDAHALIVTNPPA